jgi:phosphoglycerate-specific signal transduction histidine kinase
VQGELDRRQRLATIGQTAATVFHQVGRHHGAIGMYAHLVGRSATIDRQVVREHATRILTSVEEANRVIDELLRFSQDRALTSIRTISTRCSPSASRSARRARTRAASSWRCPRRPTSSSRSTSTR